MHLLDLLEQARESLALVLGGRLDRPEHRDDDVAGFVEHLLQVGSDSLAGVLTGHADDLADHLTSLLEDLHEPQQECRQRVLGLVRWIVVQPDADRHDRLLGLQQIVLKIPGGAHAFSSSCADGPMRSGRRIPASSAQPTACCSRWLIRWCAGSRAEPVILPVWIWLVRSPARRSRRSASS